MATPLKAFRSELLLQTMLIVVLNLFDDEVCEAKRDEALEENLEFADFEVIFDCDVLTHTEVVPLAHILDNLSALLNLLSFFALENVICFDLMDKLLQTALGGLYLVEARNMLQVLSENSISTSLFILFLFLDYL